MLADAINFPLVAVYGITVLLPLLAVVTAVEVLVLSGWLEVQRRRLWRPVLIANVLSTLAGWVLYLFAPKVLWLVGGRSFPDAIRYYAYGALLLIGLYWAKSVLVEGWYLVRRRMREKLDRPGGVVLRGVIVANVCSYLVVGPVFYLLTRQNMYGVEFLDSPLAVTACEDLVYFVHGETGHICRIQANGSGLETVVPSEATMMVLSRDGSLIVYNSASGGLYYAQIGSVGTALAEVQSARFIDQIDISTDARRIAWVQDERLHVSDVAHGTIRRVRVEPWSEWDMTVRWDGENPDVVYVAVGTGKRALMAWDCAGPELTAVAPNPQRVAGNYRIWPSNYASIERTRWYQHGYHMRAVPGLGAGVWVQRPDGEMVTFRLNIGLLGIGAGGPESGLPTNQPGVVVCEGGGFLYLLDAQRKKAAVLARGTTHLVINPAARDAVDDLYPDR